MVSPAWHSLRAPQYRLNVASQLDERTIKHFNTL